MLNEHLPYRSRRGGDRICPNGPDEGDEQVEGGLTRRGSLSRARLCLARDLRE